MYSGSFVSGTSIPNPNYLRDSGFQIKPRIIWSLQKQKFPGFPFMAGATQSGPDSRKFVPKTFSKSDISDLAIKFQAFVGDNSHS